MADLTFAELNTEFGSDIFTVTGGIISLDVSTLINETGNTNADEKVAEFLTKLLDLVSAAQITYNEDVGNVIKLNSYPEPTSGIPVFNATDSTFYVTSNYSVQTQAPLNKDATTAVAA